MGAIANKAAAAKGAPVQPKTAAKPQVQPKKKFGEVKPGAGVRLYLEPQADGTSASYTVKVSRIAQKTKAESFKGNESLIAELEIVASDNPQRPAGMLVSWSPSDKGKFDYYREDVKRFLAALLGAEPEQIDEEDWATVVGRTYELDEANNMIWGEETGTNEQFIGYLIDCVVAPKPLKNNPEKKFTVALWQANKTQHPDAA